MFLPDPLVVRTPGEPEQQQDQNHSLKPWSVQRNFEALAQRFPVMPSDLHFGGLVTALPASPVDGHIVMYDTGTDGVVWMLRYDAGSASAYKWQFVGGPPLTDGIAQDNGKIAAAAFTRYDFTNPVGITLPLAGDYDTLLTGNRVQANASLGNSYIESVVSSGADVYSSGDEGYQPMAAQFAAGPFAISSQNTGATAGATVKGQWSSNSTAQSVNFHSVVLRVTPVRVG